VHGRQPIGVIGELSALFALIVANILAPGPLEVGNVLVVTESELVVIASELQTLLLVFPFDDAKAR